MTASLRGGNDGKSQKQAWTDDVVLQVPLYALALTRLFPGSTVSRVEYRALKQCCTVHSLELYQVDRKSGSHLSLD